MTASTKYRITLRDFTKLRSLAMIVLMIYLVLALLVAFDLIATNWALASSQSLESAGRNYWLGTNRAGQDIWARMVFSVKSAMGLGVTVAVFSIVIGCVLGSLASLKPDGVLDKSVHQLMNMIDAIPFHLLIVLIANVLNHHEYGMHIAMITCFWTTSARVIRVEMIRLRSSDFYKMADMLNLHPLRKVFVHLLPNLKPLIMVQLMIVFVVSIKAEVVLSFLGLGGSDQVSWGLMVAESVSDIGSGHYGNLVGASIALFMLIAALNILITTVPLGKQYR